MKCIHCGKDAAKKDRPEGKCPSCGRKFAFEPTAGDPITDAAFQSAIERVSGSGTLRFTADHLYYELCRRKRRKWPLSARLGVGMGGGLVASAIAFSEAWPLAVILGVGALIGAVVSSSKTARVDRATFPGLINKWVAAHGPIRALIVPRVETSYREQKLEPDIGDYSFDRAVVCDRREIADVLVANRFHFENNCAILTIDGYPERTFETIRSMLQRNPQIAVFALHDCTPAGCLLAHQLSHDPAWFRGIGKVIDVGLRPGHASRFPGVWLDAGETPNRAWAHAHFTNQEFEWLSLYRLELAALVPEQLVKRLFFAINQHESGKNAAQAEGSSGSAGDGVVWYVDGSSFGGDAHASDGGGDSFG